MRRKILSVLSVFFLILALAVPVRAADADRVELYAQSMVQYYRYYREDARDAIRDLAEVMATVDPKQAEVWSSIMEDWDWVNSGMPVGENVLPDGLPEDDSLCIVVLGYGLNEDGSMKEELVDRLVVALSSAIKYPNAWIAVSGGETSGAKSVTEAGQMASWLQRKGIEKSRIITETQSLSTTANAVNVYKLLNASYPQVDSVAMISSDYHITWGCAMFTTVSNYRAGYQGGRPLKLLASAVCDTGKTADTMLQQAWGVCTITGIDFKENAPAPAFYKAEEEGEPAQEPAETDAHPNPPSVQNSEQEEPRKDTNYTAPILLLVLLAAVVYILMPKKPRKKRKRPEWKWE